MFVAKPERESEFQPLKLASRTFAQTPLFSQPPDAPKMTVAIDFRVT